MSSQKTTKWSSSSSLSKIFSRISRTLSFSSKKSQQTLKNNNKKVKPVETVIKNVNFIPQSAPVIRRHQPQTAPKVIFIDNSKNNLKPTIYRNMYADSDIEEEEDDDYSRYSLRPNLSLFNISAENLNYQSMDFSRQHHGLDDIFHSTKIEDY